MHSRVFQLSEYPIDKEDILKDIDFGHSDGFLGNIADYVSSECNREEDIKWLLNSYGKYGITREQDEAGNDYFVFSEDFKENYFRPKYESLKEMVSKLTLDVFSTSYYSAYSLVDTVDDRYGFYVYFYEPETLDSFVRDLQPGERYYIGSTIDYHH